MTWSEVSATAMSAMAASPMNALSMGCGMMLVLENEARSIDANHNASDRVITLSEILVSFSGVSDNFPGRTLDSGALILTVCGPGSNAMALARLLHIREVLRVRVVRTFIADCLFFLPTFEGVL